MVLPTALDNVLITTKLLGPREYSVVLCDETRAGLDYTHAHGTRRDCAMCRDSSEPASEATLVLKRRQWWTNRFTSRLS